MSMKKIEIYEFQLKSIYDALRMVANSYGCRDNQTCLDRCVTQAEKYAQNALKGDIDKVVRYGVTKDF